MQTAYSVFFVLSRKKKFLERDVPFLNGSFNSVSQITIALKINNGCSRWMDGWMVILVMSCPV